MTNDSRILIIGAGPAGISAAITLAEKGERVLLVDKAPGPGGAIYRESQTRGGHIRMPAAHAARRHRLTQALEALSGKIEILTRTRFAGVDWRGAVLLSRDSTGEAEIFVPRGLILATGACESVRPRPGWTLPGVTTVGALQIALKSTGALPEGRVVLAGNGPLLLAAGAQMARAGNPPAAIIEAASPFRSLARGAALPRAYWTEAAGAFATLFRHRVPLLTGAALERISPQPGGGFRLDILKASRRKHIMADHVGLHDGIAPNATGLLPPDTLPTERAGDGRAALGAAAAVADGVRAAHALLSALGREIPLPGAITATLTREERAQAHLRHIYTPRLHDSLPDLPDETIICRCENRTAGDLRALCAREGDSIRTLRLRGRFGMGSCQGRGCLPWVAMLTGAADRTAALTGTRWPAAPVPVSALARAKDRTAAPAEPDSTHATRTDP